MCIMSSTTGKKRNADTEPTSSEPSSSKLPCLLPEIDSVVPPPPPTLKEEPYLRLDLLEMSEIPHYWKDVWNIGSGAFGKVHLIHSDHIDQTGQKIIHNEFAIKSIRFAPAKLVSVVREIEMHRKCRNHENVLFLGLCYCQKVNEGYRVQMCMQYAGLSDLSLFAGKYKYEKHVAYCVEGLLQGLEHVHSCGVVHGDVSLKNVLMTHTGTIKLADFGCAHTVEYTRHDQQKFIGGTPGYVLKVYVSSFISVSQIAPEVIKKGGFDTKADIWSVASFTAFLMSGVNPFKRGIIFDLELYTKLILENVEPIIPIEFSDDLKNFLKQMFCYDPLERMTATSLLSHNFLQTKVAQKEMADYYKEIRTCQGIDLPYPHESETPFYVPCVKE